MLSKSQQCHVLFNYQNYASEWSTHAMHCLMYTFAYWYIRSGNCSYFFLRYMIFRTALNPSRNHMPSTNIYETFMKAEKQHSNVKDGMLSDPSTYPLIFILGCAMAGCSGFGFWHLAHAPDVRLNPAKRNELFRDWSRTWLSFEILWDVMYSVFIVGNGKGRNTIFSFKQT